MPSKLDELIALQRETITLLQARIAQLEAQVAQMPAPPKGDDLPRGDARESADAHKRLLDSALQAGDTENYRHLGAILHESPGSIQVEAYGPADPIRPDSLRARMNARAVRQYARLQWENFYGMRPNAPARPAYLDDDADVSQIPAELLAGLENALPDDDGDDGKSLTALLHEVDAINHGTPPQQSPAAGGRIVMVPADGREHVIGERQ